MFNVVGVCENNLTTKVQIIIDWVLVYAKLAPPEIPAMAVTESTLLSSFLLPPASLSVSLSLLQFTELFPKARQSDAVIPVLYRELQQQRAQEIARVRQNIASEAKRGEAQQRQIRRVRQARLHQELEEDGVELEMEAQVHGKNSFVYSKD